MVRAILIRGMLVGLLAGVAAFTVARIVGEPQVIRAIALEESPAADGDRDAHDRLDAPVVSRTVQSTAGLLTGTAVAGVALGGLFSLVFAFALGRFGPSTPRELSLTLAGAAFLTGSVVPFLKYPPNPPAVGDPDTIGQRTALYLATIALAMAAAGLAAALRRRLLARHDRWNATLAAAGAWLAVVVIAHVVMPDASEAPAGYPADLLWDFRLASLTVQAVLWATIGVVFGMLTERSLHSAPLRRSVPSLTT